MTNFVKTGFAFGRRPFLYAHSKEEIIAMYG